MRLRSLNNYYPQIMLDSMTQWHTVLINKMRLDYTVQCDRTRLHIINSTNNFKLKQAKERDHKTKSLKTLVFQLEMNKV